MSAKRGLPAKIANLERELAFLRADMAKEVTARVELILQARSIVDAEFDPGASVAGIKAATVSAVRGPAFIDGKCDAYIEAHFDASSAVTVCRKHSSSCPSIRCSVAQVTADDSVMPSSSAV